MKVEISRVERRHPTNICYIKGNDGTFYSCQWRGQPVGVRRIAPEVRDVDFSKLTADKQTMGECTSLLYRALSRRFGFRADVLERAPWEMIARCEAGQVVRIYPKV